MKQRAKIFLLIFFFFGWGLSASPKKKLELVHQQADRLEYDDRLKIMRLAGHVKLWQGDTVLECDKATYDLKTQEATAEGELVMKNPDGTVSGEKLHVFYKEKRGVVQGDVTLVYTAKDQNAKEKKNEKMIRSGPVTMTSEELDYDWGKKIATAAGNVVLTQKGRKASGDHALFEETPERLTMDGNVKLFRPPKDTLACDHLVYELQTDHASAEGHVVGNFQVKEEEKP